MQLNQVTVPTDDMQASVAFYRGLGLRLIVSSPHYARFECLTGNSTFSVHLAEKLNAGSGVVVYFECEDLDQKVFELTSLGYRFKSGPKDESWLWREARIVDPGNNEVCLYWAGENRRFPPWRVQE
jgi:catechol 2,3-dioxygenase-like lactoylglutathione lyase family enzyme